MQSCPIEPKVKTIIFKTIIFIDNFLKTVTIFVQDFFKRWPLLRRKYWPLSSI